ncbi:MAG TPA: membrane protein insertion efficiency factor YidD [Candidatus Angelobacter sp.]|jgi:putative membrane protein insertion efficiency factor|nr:membrane protein insertion efficiency factor YidD [Candidatus Angelobacter sp.]
MKTMAARFLGFYKGAISPLLPVACRFVPSCSEYAAEAVAKHGLLHGAALGLWRLLRCNPFARGGYDPVPARPGTAERHDSGRYLASKKNRKAV